MVSMEAETRLRDRSHQRPLLFARVMWSMEMLAPPDVTSTGKREAPGTMLSSIPDRIAGSGTSDESKERFLPFLPSDGRPAHLCGDASLPLSTEAARHWRQA